MKRVLITGATGFIGSYLVKHLEGYEIQTLSLRDSNWQKQTLNCDVIIHCAGIAHLKKTISTDKYNEINCDLTRKLAQKARKENIEHFIFLSTALVYGEGNVGTITTNSELNPMSNYSKSKICAEIEIMRILEFDKLLILRLPSVIGDKMKGNYASLDKLSKWCFLFPKILNERSVIEISFLLSTINDLILSKQHGILTPFNLTFSTTELYNFFRMKRGMKTINFPVPNFITKVLIIRSKVMSKLLGDFKLENE